MHYDLDERDLQEWRREEELRGPPPPPLFPPLPPQVYERRKGTDTELKPLRLYCARTVYARRYSQQVNYFACLRYSTIYFRKFST